MPWEKSFDLDEAVDQSISVFMAKGYEATSLSDLLTAIGINKGSFYNAFGSKKKLFTQSLLKYDNEQRKAMLDELSQMQDPLKAIGSLFDALIEQSVTRDCKKGCLMVNTALDLPNHDAATEKLVKHSMSEMEVFFRQQIELGHKQESIAKSVSASETAKGLVTLVVGLRVLARGVFDEESLRVIKSQAMHLLK